MEASMKNIARPEDLSWRADELTAMSHLHELSARLTAQSDLPSLLREVLDATIGLQHADFGHIHLYNGETRSLEIVAQRGFQKEFLDYFRSVDASEGSAWGLALKDSTRLIVEDINLDPDFVSYRGIAATSGFRALQSTPLFDRGSGKPVGMLSTHFRNPHRPSDHELRITDLYVSQAADLIALRLSEQRLRESEARLQVAVDLLGLARYSWDPLTSAIEWDGRLRAMWGLSPGARVGYDVFLAGVHPEDRSRIEAAVARCIDPKGTGVYDIEYRVIGIENGVERWVATRGQTSFDKGRAVGFIGVALDITKGKQAEQRLRESEARLAAILAQIPVGVGVFDREGRLVSANGFLRRFLKAGSLPSRSPPESKCWRAFHPDGRLLEPAEYPGERALRGETVVPGVDFLLSSGGKEIWTRVSATPYHDDDGAIPGVLWMVQDIVQEKRAEQANLLLISELLHRTRNLLAVVDSLATETAASCRSLEDFAPTFRNRLAALSRVQSLLSRNQPGAATLGELVNLELRAFAMEPNGQRIVVAGPEVALSSKTVQILALALHELATNARKYGALSTSAGQLTVTWQVTGDDRNRRLALEWHEVGLASREPNADPPRVGFGRRLIEESLPFQLDAETRLEFGRNEVRCSIAIVLEPPSKSAPDGSTTAAL
jgi:PAS domain S-box-containing protein